MTAFEKLRGVRGLVLITVAAAIATLAFAAAPALAEFGLEKFAVSARNQNGTPDVQAGAHPYALTTSFALKPLQGDVKDVQIELPPGFAGDPNATPKCGFQEFAKAEKGEASCANDTVVGIATAYITKAKLGAEVTPISIPVYNLVPPRGVAAEFGFIVAGVTPVLLSTSVRTGEDYGLTTKVPDINQAVVAVASKVTIWGVPANPAHNLIRGTCERELGGLPTALEAPGMGMHGEEDELEGPIYRQVEERETGLPEITEPSEASGGCATEAPEVPLLTNPTACGVPRTATISVDSWEEPGVFRSMSAPMPEIRGCESLVFNPSINVTPEKTSGSTPTGVGVAVSVPQEATLNPRGLAESDAKTTTVTLPEGMQVNPSSADGLQACSIAQIGFTESKELNPTSEPRVKTPQFVPRLHNPATGQDEPTLCPNASKIANVRVKTPLLEGELEGSMYLASPQNSEAEPLQNPFSSLIALYLVAEEPKTGVLVKLAGDVTPNPVTGQLTTTFEQTPQLPFSELHVEFYAGDRAPLATPALCGIYGTEASMTSWSSALAVPASWYFPITSGPNGGSCSSNPLPFAPSLAAGTTSINAGAFGPLTTTISREDGQQTLHDVSVTFPTGVSAILTGVPLCAEAQANAGTCGAASQIGEATASAGFGNDPYTVTGGRVYLTESYDGAPFGVSIVTPAVAGPFNLGNVVVRAKLEINPLSATATVTTTGEIPHILHGIPLQIRHVNVTVNRPGFAINPTSCNPLTVTGTIGATEGATSHVSAPFQLANCANLKFQPKLTVSTKAHSSKKLGASLNFKLSYPKNALGSQAWFDEAKLVIPKQLPAELKTIQ